MKYYDLRGKRVWVAGHRGMVGSALVRRLEGTGATILTIDRDKLDIRRQDATESWMSQNRPDAVFLAAATVGGIHANSSRPAEFLYDNLAVASNVIHTAASTGVSRLVFLGSSCFYPREAEQPIREDTLLTGPLEPTNEWYAIAKIAGAKLCQAYRRQHGKDFITAVPTNLYGPGDNFDPSRSHVIAALIRKIHDAKIGGMREVELWGTGSPTREFLYVDDAADALVHLMESYSEEQIINVAGGEDISIRALAALIAEVIGYAGKFRFDVTRPDGMPRKALDANRLSTKGWQPRTTFRAGLARTYDWFLEQEAK